MEPQPEAPHVPKGETLQQLETLALAPPPLRCLGGGGGGGGAAAAAAVAAGAESKSTKGSGSKGNAKANDDEDEDDDDTLNVVDDGIVLLETAEDCRAAVEASKADTSGRVVAMLVAMRKKVSSTEMQVKNY